MSRDLFTPYDTENEYAHPPSPFQKLAAFKPARPSPAWAKTAPVLRRWADALDHSEDSGRTQAEAICAHMAQVWLPVWLEACPKMAMHAASLRLSAGASDWSDTARVADGAARAVEGIAISDDDAAGAVREEAAAQAAQTAREDAAAQAARGAVWDARLTRGHTDDIRTFARCDSAALSAARVIYHRDPDRLPAVVARASEQWILLADVWAFARVPTPLHLGLYTPDGYAAAWRWLAAKGKAAGRTDDDLRVSQGVDATGAPIPEWARRTALVRAILRVTL